MEGPRPPPKGKKGSSNVEGVPRVGIVQILAELKKEELLRILLELELADDELVHMIAEAVRSHPDYAETVVKVADRDVRKRQVLVRGLGPQTTVETLHQVWFLFFDVGLKAMAGEED